jgi:hypothetical protein
MAAAASAAAFIRQTKRAADTIWNPWAEAHGLSYVPGRSSWAALALPRIDGSLSDVGVAFLVERHLGDRRGIRTRAAAVPPTPLPGNVEVTREGIVSTIAKFFAAMDIPLDDPKFD